MALHIKVTPILWENYKTKNFTNAKLLSELSFFERSIKGKIKQLSTKKLLQEQPFCKQSIKEPRIKKLKKL